LLNHLTGTFFSACFGFWRWLGRQDALSALADGPPLDDPPDDDFEADEPEMPWSDN
jgi:hypothetical protein